MRWMILALAVLLLLGAASASPEPSFSKLLPSQRVRIP